MPRPRYRIGELLPNLEATAATLDSLPPALGRAPVLSRSSPGLEALAQRVAQADGRLVVCLEPQERPQPLSFAASFVCPALMPAGELERQLEELDHAPDRVVPRVIRYQLRSLQDAESVALLIAHVLPAPERRVLGTLELCLNAVEHGNLELSAELKQRLLAEGQWAKELSRRMSLPAFKHRVATVELVEHEHLWTLTVQDQGPGFDLARAETASSGSGLRGRGLALARAMSFDALTFERPGNRAIATVRKP